MSTQEMPPFRTLSPDEWKELTLERANRAKNLYSQAITTPNGLPQHFVRSITDRATRSFWSDLECVSPAAQEEYLKEVRVLRQQHSLFPRRNLPPTGPYHPAGEKITEIFNAQFAQLQIRIKDYTIALGPKNVRVSMLKKVAYLRWNDCQVAAEDLRKNQQNSSSST